MICLRRLSLEGASGSDRKRLRRARPTATLAAGDQGNWCASFMPNCSTRATTSFSACSVLALMVSCCSTRTRRNKMEMVQHLSWLEVAVKLGQDSTQKLAAGERHSFTYGKVSMPAAGQEGSSAQAC